MLGHAAPGCLCPPYEQDPGAPWLGMATCPRADGERDLVLVSLPRVSYVLGTVLNALLGDTTDFCLQRRSGREARPWVAGGVPAREWPGPRLLPPGRKEDPEGGTQRGPAGRGQGGPQLPGAVFVRQGPTGVLERARPALNTLLPLMRLAKGVGVRRASPGPEDRWQPAPGWLGLAGRVGSAMTLEREDCLTAGNINKFPKAGRSRLPRRLSAPGSGPDPSALETPLYEFKVVLPADLNPGGGWLSLGCPRGPHPFHPILAQRGACWSTHQGRPGHLPAPRSPHLLNG